MLWRMSNDVIYVHHGREFRFRVRVFSAEWWLVAGIRAAIPRHRMPCRLRSGIVVSRRDGVLVITRDGLDC